LAPHLTAANHQNVLALARHKGKREVEELVASLRPFAASSVNDPEVARPSKCAGGNEPGRTHANADSAEPASGHAGDQDGDATDGDSLAPERYKVQFTISRETQEKLRRVQALSRHAVPSGDPAEIFDRALTLLLQDLERRRCAAVTSPRAARGAAGGSRHIPASVKREVWRRDDGHCAYTGRDGRCTERSFLEYHHVQPYAAGGAATAANIELRCRAHNVYEASLLFGLEGEHVVEIPAT